MLKGVLSTEDIEQITKVESLEEYYAKGYADHMDSVYMHKLSNDISNEELKAELISTNILTDQHMLKTREVSASAVVVSKESLNNLVKILGIDKEFVETYNRYVPSNENIDLNPLSALSLSIEEKINLWQRVKDNIVSMYSKLSSQAIKVVKSVKLYTDSTNNKIDKLLEKVDKLETVDLPEKELLAIKNKLAIYGLFNGSIEPKGITEFLKALDLTNVINEHAVNSGAYVKYLSDTITINDGEIPYTEYVTVVEKMAQVFDLESSRKNNFLKSIASDKLTSILTSKFEDNPKVREIGEYQHVRYLPYNISNNTLGLIVTLYNDIVYEDIDGNKLPVNEIAKQVQFRDIVLKLKPEVVESLDVVKLSISDIKNIANFIKSELKSAKSFNVALSKVIDQHKKELDNLNKTIKKLSNVEMKQNIDTYVYKYRRIVNLSMTNMVNDAVFDYINGINAVIKYCEAHTK